MINQGLNNGKSSLVDMNIARGDTQKTRNPNFDKYYIIMRSYKPTLREDRMSKFNELEAIGVRRVL